MSHPRGPRIDKLAHSVVQGVRISTVAIDLGTDEEPVYETMTFGGKWDDGQWRTRDHQQALEMHLRVFIGVKNGEDPESEPFNVRHMEWED